MLVYFIDAELVKDIKFRLSTAFWRHIFLQITSEHKNKVDQIRGENKFGGEGRIKGHMIGSPFLTGGPQHTYNMYLVRSRDAAPKLATCTCQIKQEK